MSIIMLYLIFTMFTVIYLDVTRFIIPNWLVGGLLLVYPVAVYLSPVPVDWKMALVAMFGVFAVGYGVFAMNWMGGGDIKLITVLSLWVGLDKLMPFFLNFALFGGVLSLSVLVIRKLIPHITSKRETLPRILRDKEPVPYGVAISIAFLLMLTNGEVPAVAFAASSLVP